MKRLFWMFGLFYLAGYLPFTFTLIFLLLFSARRRSFMVFFEKTCTTAIAQKKPVRQLISVSGLLYFKRLVANFM